MAIRDLKWHIYNKDYPGQPLTWDGTALEFDTEESAQRFLESLPICEENQHAYVTSGILYYDGGYMNATGKIMEYAPNGEEILVEVTKNE